MIWIASRETVIGDLQIARTDRGTSRDARVAAPLSSGRIRTHDGSKNHFRKDGRSATGAEAPARRSSTSL